jgi:hypothetical protein
LFTDDNNYAPPENVHLSYENIFTSETVDLYFLSVPSTSGSFHMCSSWGTVPASEPEAGLELRDTLSQPLHLTGEGGGPGRLTDLPRVTGTI